MAFDDDELRRLLAEERLEGEADTETGFSRAPDPAQVSIEDLPTTTAAIYFRDIASTTLLTAADEIVLAQEIEGGDDARRLLEHPHLSDEERARLEEVTAAGERARRRLTEANLRLVVSVARKYVNRGLPMLDLIQEGNIGLARAVEKFDWRKGYRFSTYAYWWIRQGMTRALSEQTRQIRVPTHMVAAIGEVYRAARDLQQELGREPRVPEIAEHLGLTPARVLEIQASARQPLSLEAPLSREETGGTLGDLIPDRSLRTPHEMAAHSLLRRHMDDAMQVLSPRERRVLRLRYGLDGGREHTLGEIADEIGVTSERIRQIEAAAITKLRQPKLRNKLREYLDEYVA